MQRLRLEAEDGDRCTCRDRKRGEIKRTQVRLVDECAEPAVFGDRVEQREQTKPDRKVQNHTDHGCGNGGQRGREGGSASEVLNERRSEKDPEKRGDEGHPGGNNGSGDAGLQRRHRIRIGPNHKPRPTARTLTARLSEGWPSVTSPSSTSAVAASSTSVSSCPWIRLNSSGRTRPPMSPTGDRHADDQWEWQLKEEDANERGGSDGEHDRVLDDAPSDSQNSAGNNGNHGCRNAKEQSRHPREVAVRRKQDAQHHDRKEPRQDEERTSEKPTRWPSQ
ncbi:hypothetical protein GQR58_028509 [Nymphon striatum]|nr:hypothetical protein GQR58_028509 [Nymphon striatum]